MKYAVIAISGTQYQVAENDIITVDNLNLNDGDKKICDQVLLAVDEKKVIVGNPTVKDASVAYEIVKNYQGDKLKVYKYKAKSRYHKTIGFRPQLTDIKITKINL
jgi:large subunit ribosomal protein L21